MIQPDTFITSILRQPGTMVFPGNRPYVEDLVGAGGRIQRHESGHLVFYGASNRRILMTDPDGHPLHECEWGQAPDGHIKLIAARLHLEWGQWVGLSQKDLSIKPSLTFQPDLAGNPFRETIFDSWPHEP